MNGKNGERHAIKRSIKWMRERGRERERKWPSKDDLGQPATIRRQKKMGMYETIYERWQKFCYFFERKCIKRKIVPNRGVTQESAPFFLWSISTNQGNLPWFLHIRLIMRHFMQQNSCIKSCFVTFSQYQIFHARQVNRFIFRFHDGKFGSSLGSQLNCG